MQERHSAFTDLLLLFGMLATLENKTIFTRLKYEVRIFVPRYFHAFYALNLNCRVQLNVGAIGCSKQRAPDRKQLSIYSKTPAVKLLIISVFTTNYPAVRSSRSIISVVNLQFIKIDTEKLILVKSIFDARSFVCACEQSSFDKSFCHFLYC